MICKGYSLIVINKTIPTSLSFRQRPLFVVGRLGRGKKRERAGDDGKGNEMNIDYIQYSSEIRRHLEMHYRAEERLPHFDVFKSTLTCTLIKDCYKVKPCLVLLTIQVLNTFNFGVYCSGYYVEVLKYTALNKVANIARLLVVVPYYSLYMPQSVLLSMTKPRFKRLV